MDLYLREATASARRIKDLNPGTNITIVTNPGFRPDMSGAFDMVRYRNLRAYFPQSWMTIVV